MPVEITHHFFYQVQMCTKYYVRQLKQEGRGFFLGWVCGEL